ncbi:SDR family oxidoreductase [Aurantibacter crassamenti]|uniref:SDR family NAD(P)-dependent oxidoreductase n=1 Tax=Aurantibacter crassamenti TaxID=1837375 RepID=UPI00193A414F|nr:SDR family oxidoreductase [Aurantibacter crassamenti]MBM1105056.1 SDR family oxidoreductase [Aurantibacter crassamenti]
MLKIDLSNKKFLISGGAGTGVGSGICQAIAACGGQILLNDINFEKAKEAAKEYPNAFPVPGDISNQKEVEQIFKSIKSEHGVIHGLVNNAGVGLRKEAHLAEESDFDKLYNIDVKGVWMMAKAFVNQLIFNNIKGHIVNVSSVHAHETLSKYAIYASAKSAVEGLTRGMSIELGELGIRCNAIAPGYVDSIQNYEAAVSWTDNPESFFEDQRNEYQSLRHAINARDCGNITVFLLSDLARSITGQTIIVDAGLTNLLHANSFIQDKK